MELRSGAACSTLSPWERTLTRETNATHKSATSNEFEPLQIPQLPTSQFLAALPTAYRMLLNEYRKLREEIDFLKNTVGKLSSLQDTDSPLECMDVDEDSAGAEKPEGPQLTKTPPQTEPGSRSSPRLQTTIILNKNGHASKQPMDIANAFHEGMITLNASNQRVDQRIHVSDDDALQCASVVAKERPCKVFVLHGKCEIALCQFKHEKLPKTVVRCLCNALRKTPCRQGFCCRRPQFPYGHHCQLPMDHNNVHGNCLFDRKEQNGLDTEVASWGQPSGKALDKDLDHHTSLTEWRRYPQNGDRLAMDATHQNASITQTEVPQAMGGAADPSSRPSPIAIDLDGDESLALWRARFQSRVKASSIPLEESQKSTAEDRSSKSAETTPAAIAQAAATAIAPLPNYEEDLLAVDIYFQELVRTSGPQASDIHDDFDELFSASKVANSEVDMLLEPDEDLMTFG